MAALLKGSAFITGAASGIGKNAAIAFARHGINRLALADFNKRRLDTTVEELKKFFPTIDFLPLHMDVRSNAQVKSSIAETVKAFGRLDVAINNAGMGNNGRLTHSQEDEEIETILDINLNGVYRCQKAQLGAMVTQEDLGPRDGRGRIINVTSIYGLVAPNQWIPSTPYSTAKHGVIGLTKADANAYAGYGIRINAIAPGFVTTPLIEATISTATDSPLGKEIDRLPLKRMATGEEIADALVFLASPMSSYMQGTVQVVDGGFTSN